MRTSPQGFGEFSREIQATHEKPVGIGSGRSARAPPTTAGMCAQIIRGHRYQQPAAMIFWPRLALSTLRGPMRAEVAGPGWIWPRRCSERWFTMGV